MGVMELDESLDPLTTNKLAERLNTSATWVRKNRGALGGVKKQVIVKDKNNDIRTTNTYVFPEDAVKMGLMMIEASGLGRGVVVVCKRCGGREVVQRGRMRAVEIEQPHLWDCQAPGRLFENV